MEVLDAGGGIIANRQWRTGTTRGISQILIDDPFPLDPHVISLYLSKALGSMNHSRCYFSGLTCYEVGVVHGLGRINGLDGILR